MMQWGCLESRLLFRQPSVLLILQGLCAADALLQIDLILCAFDSLGCGSKAGIEREYFIPYFDSSTEITLGEESESFAVQSFRFALPLCSSAVAEQYFCACAYVI